MLYTKEAIGAALIYYVNSGMKEKDMQKRRHIIFIIIGIMPVPLHAAVYTNHVAALKTRLQYEIEEFRKCIKSEPNCDPLRKKIYITTGTIIAVLFAIVTGKIVHCLIKKPKKPITIPTSQIPEEEPNKELIKISIPQIPPEESDKEPKISISEESGESEGEEKYYSARTSSSSEEGYVSADDKGEELSTQEVQGLEKKVKEYEDLYWPQFNLLMQAGLGKTDPKVRDEINARLKNSKASYDHAQDEANLPKKLEYLKLAFNMLRKR